MSLRKHQRGEGTIVTLRRVQKRNKRRLLEAPAHKWKEWDAAAAREGLNWSEFTRRALLQRVSSLDELLAWARAPERTASERSSVLERLPGLSEKPAAKNGAAKRAKAPRPGARGKGSSRS